MITDFVHLKWAFTSKAEYPKKDGLYLCLIAPADIAPKTELKVLFYDSDVGIFYDEDECKYLCVVAWADPTRFCFTCDPEKYEGCDKDLCYTRNHGPFSPHYCKCTTHLEYAKGYDFH